MKSLFYVLPLAIFAGCSSNTTSFTPVASTANSAATPDTSSTRSTQAPADNNTNAADANTQNGTKIPAGMGVGSRMTLTPTPALDKKIAAAVKGGNKKQIADAYAARGTFRMNDSGGAPKVIYRAALQDYRQALKFDATNKEAQTNKALIESIYKQMGRPIPAA